MKSKKHKNHEHTSKKEEEDDDTLTVNVIPPENDPKEDHKDALETNNKPVPSSTSKAPSLQPQSIKSTSTIGAAMSKLSLMVQRSLAAIATAFTGKDDDGCALRGCQWCIWFHAILLLGGGVWSGYIWIDLLLGLSGTKFWASEFQPGWLFFSEFYALIICWTLPIVCSVWLTLSTIFCRRTLARTYYIVMSWLIFLPIGFSIYFIFYLGKLSPIKLESVLKKHLTNYKEGLDTENWDNLQVVYKCCGVNSPGWKDWVNAGMLEKTVPLSCCKDPENLADGCPKFPSDENTFREGCLKKLYNDYISFSTMAMFGLCYIVVTIGISIFSVTRYYTFLQRDEINSDYEFSSMRFFMECLCPCTICCMKDPFPIRPRHVQETRRTTEVALLHRIERYGVPLSHEEEYNKIIKENKEQQRKQSISYDQA